MSLKQVFPFFILFFIGASVITTIATAVGVPAEVFVPLKDLSKFFIIMAMAAIGFNTDLGMSCWLGITIVSLGMQHVMHIW